MLADASQREFEVAERDSRIASLDHEGSILKAELAGRDAQIAMFEMLELSRQSEQQTAEFLQRLIYESQQEILRDFTILERLDAVERRGAKIEAHTDQTLSMLSRAEEEPTPPASVRPGRRWASHLPSPSTLKARLKAPARNVLASLGVVGRGPRR